MCAQLTRDLFAIAKFLSSGGHQNWYQARVLCATSYSWTIAAWDTFPMVSEIFRKKTFKMAGFHHAPHSHLIDCGNFL